MQVYANASAEMRHAPETVFDYTIDPDNYPKVFRGYGPVPAMNKMTLLNGATALAVGVERDVQGADGSLLHERITRLERPRHYDYAVLGGLAKPLSFLVRGAAVTWEFVPIDAGTRVVWRFVWTLTSPLMFPVAFGVTRLLQIAMRQCLERIDRNLRG